MRYLTSDPAIAELARLELAELQKETRSERQLRRTLRETSRALRQAKVQSMPCVRALGLVYHGYGSRRPRKTQAGPRSLPREGE